MYLEFYFGFPGMLIDKYIYNKVQNIEVIKKKKTIRFKNNIFSHNQMKN